ncbi:hypothetical protein BD779DRAFT_1676102 [Infundibulicybe gibba]|nr:hypothetical protein BD779DRAFT_1676102 [Infundibulicybe gibba]
MAGRALPRRVIVDDTDPQIQYSTSDQWISSAGGANGGKGVGGPAFWNATRVALGTASLSFRFNGSSPQVFGTSLGAGLECFVDGTSIGSTGGPLSGNNSQSQDSDLLCDGSTFVEGREHILTLNVSAVPQLETKLWLNYITYIPFASVPPGATTLVDRLDPAITYWPVKKWNTPSDLYAYATFTQVNGSYLKFNFNGTSVSWVGYTPGQEPPTNATYSIDGSEWVPFLLNTPPSGLNMSNQVFFTLPDLSPGPHSLVVMHRGDNTSAPLTLNHFVITSASASSLPPAMSSAVATNHKINVSILEAIVDGTIGGIVVLCIVAFLLWRRNHRRRFGNREWLDIEKDNGKLPPHVTPFDAMPSDPTMAETRSCIPKAHFVPIGNSFELSPHNVHDSPSGIAQPGAVPKSRNCNVWKALPRIPPAVLVREDSRGAGGTADGHVDPPPSYAS